MHKLALVHKARPAFKPARLHSAQVEGPYQVEFEYHVEYEIEIAPEFEFEIEIAPEFEFEFEFEIAPDIEPLL